MAQAAASPYYVLALDYGSVRVGVAIASSIARLPRPLTTLANNEQLVDEIITIVEHEAIGQIVVGLPRNMKGEYTQQTYDAENFGQALAQRLAVPIAFADETLTSVDAESVLAGKKHDKGAVDALAATYILERYFAEQASQEVVQ
jgi:putative holliday junction resolvase